MLWIYNTHQLYPVTTQHSASSSKPVSIYSTYRDAKFEYVHSHFNNSLLPVCAYGFGVFPKSVSTGTETHVSVNVRFHRKRIGFVLAFGSSLVLGAIHLCLGCGVGFLGTKVLGLWFRSLGI